MPSPTSDPSKQPPKHHYAKSDRHEMVRTTHRDNETNRNEDRYVASDGALAF